MTVFMKLLILTRALLRGFGISLLASVITACGFEAGGSLKESEGPRAMNADVESRDELLPVENDLRNLCGYVSLSEDQALTMGPLPGIPRSRLEKGLTETRPLAVETWQLRFEDRELEETVREFAEQAPGLLCVRGTKVDTEDERRTINVDRLIGTPRNGVSVGNQ